MSVATGDGLRLATPRGRWVLAGTVLGSGVVSLDATVVNIALPRLADGLDTDFAGMQWVVNGYTLTLAALILVGGALGDRFGRRRIFALGVAWFAIASLLCGIAPNVQTLVVARMLQGVGGALLTPGSLAIIQASFHPDDRARAIGAWSGLGGVTTAIGPFAGGWLIDVASWRWIFLVNLPLSAFVLWIAARHIPESKSPDEPGPLDIPGVVLGAAGLALTTWGLIDRSWVLGGAGIAALVAFVVAEWRKRQPMLPLGIFRSRQFSAANLSTLFVYAGLGMVFFMLGLVLQEALGYSPLEAGAASFPVTALMLVFSARSGALAQKIGPRWQMTIGPLVIAAGMVLMTRIDAGASYVTGVLPAVLVFGAGLSILVAPLTATVLAAADSQHSGIASGVNNAVARVGGLLAVAAIPVIAGFDPTGDVDPSVLVDGFHTAALGAAALTAIGAAVSFAAIRADTLAAAPGDAAPAEPTFHCAADAPPLQVAGGASAADRVDPEPPASRRWPHRRG